MRKQRLHYTLGTSVIVVLGGGVRVDGTPWPATVLRAEMAAKLASQFPNATIVCSGGRGREAQRASVPEGVALAQIIWKTGIDHRRILVESDSVDTIGNAILVAARYLDGQKRRPPIHLVTSPFHTARAALCFSSVLGPSWTVQVHACDPASDNDRRAAQEADLSDTIEFFRPVTPGNLPQAAKRLLEVGKPFYHRLPLLTGLAFKAAA